MLGTAYKSDIEEMIDKGELDQLRVELCESLAPADIAEIVEDLADAEDPKAVVIFRLLPTRIAIDVFELLEFSSQEYLIGNLSHERIVGLINAMSPDDRTELLEELPGEVTNRYLKALSPDERRIASTLLAYPEDSIGRLMTPEFIAVRPGWTVERTFQYIRENIEEVETITVIYIIDERGTLRDDVRIGRLLKADPKATMESLITEHCVHLSALDDQEEAITLFKKYDRVALPVVDSRGIMLGIVTVDDVLDVAEEEDSEDIQLFGGQEALEDSYHDTTVMQVVRKRVSWLLLFTLLGFLSVKVMDYFHGQIASMLLIFIPLILGSGGNSGSQAAAMIIRALALKEFDLTEWWRVFLRELATGLMLGLSLGVVVFGVSYFLVNQHNRSVLSKTPTSQVQQADGEISAHRTDLKELDLLIPFRVALVLMLTLLSVVTVGALLGSMLPFLFKSIGFDPAVCSGPFITTFIDVSGILIYFMIASVVI